MSGAQHFGSFQPEAFAPLARALLVACRDEAQFAPIQDHQLPQAALSASIQVVLAEADIGPANTTAALASALASWLAQKSFEPHDEVLIKHFAASCGQALQTLRAIHRRQSGGAR